MFSTAKTTQSGYWTINTNPVTTIANGTTGYADGTGAAAKFSDSIVLTGKSNGDAYFVDSGNNLVRNVHSYGRHHDSRRRRKRDGHTCRIC